MQDALYLSLLTYINPKKKKIFGEILINIKSASWRSNIFKKFCIYLSLLEVENNQSIKGKLLMQVLNYNQPYTFQCYDEKERNIVADLINSNSMINNFETERQKRSLKNTLLVRNLHTCSNIIRLKIIKDHLVSTSHEILKSSKVKMDSVVKPFNTNYILEQNKHQSHESEGAQRLESNYSNVVKYYFSLKNTKAQETLKSQLRVFNKYDTYKYCNFDKSRIILMMPNNIPNQNIFYKNLKLWTDSHNFVKNTLVSERRTKDGHDHLKFWTILPISNATKKDKVILLWYKLYSFIPK